jgi:hypothetical protein
MFRRHGFSLKFSTGISDSLQTGWSGIFAIEEKNHQPYWWAEEIKTTQIKYDKTISVFVPKHRFRNC